MYNEIEFENVTQIYKGDDIAIENVSLSIKSGEFVFLIGRSGSGKSTILKMIGGYLIPTEGVVRINGVDTKTISRGEVPFFRRKFGSFDPSIGLISDENIFSNLNFVLTMSTLSRKKRSSRIDAVLKTMNLLSKKYVLPHELSGGEYAKAMLARAIIMDPQILLIDEPTANMTATDAWDFMQLLKDINENGTTVIVASHSREIVNIMKRRTISLVAGIAITDEKRGSYNERDIDILEERKIISRRLEEKKNQKKTK